MAGSQLFYVYMLASTTRRLYIGKTSDLVRRVWEHKTRAVHGFTSRYNIDRLVWYDEMPRVIDAISRERELKGWRREKKVELLEAENPQWLDLSQGWYG